MNDSTHRPHRIDDAQLLRHLNDALTPEDAARLDARLARDPALARRREALAAVWNDLDLPAHRPDAGFAARVVARAGSQPGIVVGAAARALRLRLLGAGATLALGVTLGVGLGQIGADALRPAASPTPIVAAASPSADRVADAAAPAAVEIADAAEAADLFFDDETGDSLADDYWRAIAALAEADVGAAAVSG